MPDTDGMLNVKPAKPGTRVRNPSRGYRPLGDAGEIVPDNLFWRRRLMQGDVVLVTADDGNAAGAAPPPADAIPAAEFIIAAPEPALPQLADDQAPPPSGKSRA